MLAKVPPSSVATAVLQTAEKGKAVASSESFYAADTSDPVTDWQDYSNFYDEYDDDEEVRKCQLSHLNASSCMPLATWLCINSVLNCIVNRPRCTWHDSELCSSNAAPTCML